MLGNSYKTASSPAPMPTLQRRSSARHRPDRFLRACTHKREGRVSRTSAVGPNADCRLSALYVGTHDGVDGPLTASECQNGGRRRSPEQEPSTHEISTIGIDIAKHVFPLHGADGAGAAVLSRRLRRGQVAAFFAALQSLYRRH
jgi:hypothetical protein